MSTYPFIFDRRFTNHRWSQAFEGMERGADVTRRTICGNWRMDHRVSHDRESHMLGTPEFADKPDAEQWWKQRGDYFSRAVCRTITAGITGLQPPYIESFNDGNTISRQTIPHHDQLIHVKSLNNILWRLTGAEHASGSLSRRLRTITGQGLPERKTSVGVLGIQGFVDQVDVIARNVQQRGPNAVKELAGLLCEVLGNTQPPWWACFFQEVRPWLNKADWLAMCQLLGLGHLLSDTSSGHWLLVWRYAVHTAYPLYRPTVVEANDNPFHCPSPPSKKCGITMPLGIGLRACREVIHPPLTGENATNTCTGELGHVASASSEDYYSKLAEFRSEHFSRLQDESRDASDHNWIRRHGYQP